MQLRFPPEIWSEAFRFLGHSDWTQLRYVCRTFNDIGAQLLFSSLRIFFLDNESSSRLLLYPAVFLPESEKHHSEVEARKQFSVKSWEILDYITRNPDFAARVRSVTVYAFRDDSVIFEDLCLAGAIRKLPYLRSFRWLGGFSALPPAVAASLPAGLSSLSILGGCELGVSLDHLRHLRAISFRPLSISNGMLDPLKLNDGTLRRLNLPSQFCHEVHLRLFSNLTHLCIIRDAGIDYADFDLRFVLRHATRLESLSLTPNDMHIEEQFIASLCDSVNTLTNLVSLQLDFLAVGFASKHGIHSRLLSFIRGQRKLRRLYLHSGQLNIPAYSQSLFSLLRDMPHLQVLGLKPCHIMLPENDTSPQTISHNLIDFLPRNLKALHVDLPAPDTLFAEYDSTFVNGLGSFKHLTYFNLINRLDLLPFEASEFATENPQLQLVGHNRWVWDVQAGCTRRPSWKSYYAIYEDFEDEDHWWLYSAFLSTDDE